MEDDFGEFEGAFSPSTAIPETFVESPATDFSYAVGTEAAADIFAKGDQCWYVSRDGDWIPGKVVSVDLSVTPPSYCINLGGGRERETEGWRLRKHAERPPAQVPLPSSAEQGQEEEEIFGDFEQAAPGQAGPASAAKLLHVAYAQPQPSDEQQAPPSGASRGTPLPAELFAEKAAEEYELPSLSDSSTKAPVSLLPMPLATPDVPPAAAPSPKPADIAAGTTPVPSESDCETPRPSLDLPLNVAQEIEEDFEFGDFAAADPALPQHELHAVAAAAAAAAASLPAAALVPEPEEAAQAPVAATEVNVLEVPAAAALAVLPAAVPPADLAGSGGREVLAPAVVSSTPGAIEVHPGVQQLGRDPTMPQILNPAAVTEYGVAWLHLLQAAAVELEQGRELLMEADALDSLAPLLSTPRMQAHMRALGRVYFVAGTVRLAAAELGLLEIVEELGTVWARCSAGWEGAWEKGGRTASAGVRRVEGDSRGDGGGSGAGGMAYVEAACLRDAVLAVEEWAGTAAAGSCDGEPLPAGTGCDDDEAGGLEPLRRAPSTSQLLSSLDAAAAALPGLGDNSFPRMLSWSEDLDALTLLPLSAFGAPGGSVSDSCCAVPVASWAKGRPAVVPLANLWLHRVASQLDLD